MRILLTGSDGYVGSVMGPMMHRAGYEVRGVDSLFYEECSFGRYAARLPLLRKDIRDMTARDLSGFHAVVHLAALSNDPTGDLNPDWTEEINHRAGVRLAHLAKDAGAERFLFASSCSIYGAAGDEMATEDAPLRPLTAYAVSKVRTEEGLSAMAGEGFSPVFLRNATAYGVSPRLRLDVVLNNLTAWAHCTGKVRIMSDGTPWRPLVHVEDICRAALAALEAPRNAVHNQAFNVGVDSENYQVKDLAEIVRATVPGCTIEYSPTASADQRNYRVDFGKIRRLLPGFRPTWNASLGAAQLESAFCEQTLTLDDMQGRRYTRLTQLKHLLNSGALDSTLRWKNRQPAAHDLKTADAMPVCAACGESSQEHA
jgi:nucleoside-diphosphate-sugar epimerase